MVGAATHIFRNPLYAIILATDTMNITKGGDDIDLDLIADDEIVVEGDDEDGHELHQVDDGDIMNQNEGDFGSGYNITTR